MQTTTMPSQEQTALTTADYVAAYKTYLAAIEVAKADYAVAKAAAEDVYAEATSAYRIKK